MPMQYIIFNKPYGVLTQFTGGPDEKTLADFDLPKDVYAAGRLDKDSEGLLLLTDDGYFNQKITNPKNEKEKTYWAQVDGDITPKALTELANGVELDGKMTLKAKAHKITQPEFLWERVPPIRIRQAIPTSWIALTLTEGRNRQVRRMTAKVGFPTLRLIRAQIGKYHLTGELAPGQWKNIKMSDII